MQRLFSLHAAITHGTPVPRVTSLAITHFIPAIRLADGGVVRAVLDLCRLTSAGAHQITLLTYDASDVPPEWQAGGRGFPRLVTLPRVNGLGRLPAAALRIARPLLDQADVLHLHGMWLPSNLQLAALARELGTPLVLTPHGMLDDWATAQRRLKKRAFHSLFGRRFIQQASRIHCTAEEEKRQALPWLGTAPVTVLPCLVDLEPYRDLAAPAQSPKASIPTLLFLGRLHPKKGPDLLIQTVAELRRRNQSVRLLIAGQGEASYEARLKEQTQQVGLDDCVRLLGLVTGPAKLSLLQSADLFVLPTSQENFGLALIEAAACGTPVLTTKGVDIWRELESAGAAIAERSAIALADAIERLLHNPAQLQSRGRTLREWVFQTLDPGRLLLEYERMYESVI